MDPELSTKVLSSVFEDKKVMMCVMEKIPVLDKLPSGMSFSAVGHEFHANESTIYIKEDVFKNRTTFKTRFCLDLLTKIHLKMMDPISKHAIFKLCPRKIQQINGAWHLILLSTL